MDLILKYFPELTAIQRQRFEALEPLYREWNSRINVISRKDMDQFYLHHVLHSLAIAKVCRFDPGARVMDPALEFQGGIFMLQHGPTPCRRTGSSWMGTPQTGAIPALRCSRQNGF